MKSIIGYKNKSIRLSGIDKGGHYNNFSIIFLKNTN
jgi:hypothetical protein